MTSSSLRRWAVGLGPAASLLGSLAWFAGCASSTPAPAPTRASSSALAGAGDETDSDFHGFDLLGEAVLSTLETFRETPVGGLSSLAYDAERDLYYAICDDPASRGPARFYSLDIDLSDGSLDAAKVEVVAVTELLDKNSASFAEMTLDLESLSLTPEGTLLISSEGQVDRGVEPFLREYRLDGSFIREFEVPEKFLPRADQSGGVRHNLGFESMAVDLEAGVVYTAVENALRQDGPAADVGVASPARFLRFDRNAGRPAAEYVYWVEPVGDAPVGAGDFRTRGLVELEALGNSRLLALERAYTQGVGNRIEIFLISVEGATDVSRWKSLAGKSFEPVKKTRLLSLDVLGLELDNIEGLTFGPRLADGRRTLVLISDNNFNPNQRTQILAFAVEDHPLTPSQVQGAGHRSPLEGAWVRGVRGTVTSFAAQGPGFWIQGEADADNATSDALFVAPSGQGSVHPGDVVLVEGLVEEAGFPGDLPVTTLGGARFEVVAREEALPIPIKIGATGAESPAGKRTLPSHIDDDRLTIFEPDDDAIDFFESLEGMRVETSGVTVTGPTSRFGEIAVVDQAMLPDGVARSRAGGWVVTAETESPPPLLLVPQPGTAAPTVAVGDRFEEPVVGVIDYAFGTFRILAEPMPRPVLRSRGPKPTPPARGDGALLVATYNVENLSARDDSAKIGRLGESIASALGAPDILALQEIQDDSGGEDDGTVTSEQTLLRLIDAISTAGGPHYAHLTIDPEDGADGGRPGGNIRVAYLYRPDRVRFVARGLPRIDSAGEWLTDERGPFLSPNPARLSPDHPAFSANPARNLTGSRKPLAAEFEFGERRLFLVNVHLRSKRGDSPLYGAVQPPKRTTEPLRHAESLAIRDFLDRLFELDPRAAAIILGDFNEHPYRSPMLLFQDLGFVNLVERVPESERYTYIFRGTSQVLDNVLISDGLASSETTTHIVHTNSDQPDAGRASDHDPILFSIEILQALGER